MAQQRRNQRPRQGERKPPDYRVYAVIDKGKQDDPADWVYIGGAWEGANDTISFTMQSEPLAWKTPHAPRRVTLVRNGDD